MREDIARLDATTLRAMLGDKLELAIRLLEAEGEVGDPGAERLLAALRG